MTEANLSETISYAIPLYNKARYIAGVLDSVIAEYRQTGGEIIVYDDASTDNSAAIVANIAALAPVRLIRGERNAGVFAATNILVREAACPFLRIIDADDQIAIGSTRHLLENLQRHDGVLIHGGSSRIGKDSLHQDFSRAVASVDADPFRDAVRSVNYNLSVSLIRTDCAKAVLPLPPERRISQDLCLSLRLTRLGRFVTTDGMVALCPEEWENRLSGRRAAMYRDICLIIADELKADASPAHAAFAVRRHAARCQKYFRREAPGKLGVAEKLFLTGCRAALPVEPLSWQADRLRRVAGFYTRDEARALA